MTLLAQPLQVILQIYLLACDRHHNLVFLLTLGQVLHLYLQRRDLLVMILLVQFHQVILPTYRLAYVQPLSQASRLIQDLNRLHQVDQLLDIHILDHHRPVHNPNVTILTNRCLLAILLIYPRV